MGGGILVITFGKSTIFTIKIIDTGIKYKLVLSTIGNICNKAAKIANNVINRYKYFSFYLLCF